MLIDKQLRAGDIVKTGTNEYWLCTCVDFGSVGYVHMGYRTGENNITVIGNKAEYKIGFDTRNDRCSSLALPEGAEIIDRINAAELARFNNEMAMKNKTTLFLK